MFAATPLVMTPLVRNQKVKVTTVAIDGSPTMDSLAPLRLQDMFFNDLGLKGTLEKHPICFRFMRDLNPEWCSQQQTWPAVEEVLRRWPGLAMAKCATGDQIRMALIKHKRRTAIAAWVDGAIDASSVPLEFLAEELVDVCSTMPELIPTLLDSLDKRLRVAVSKVMMPASIDARGARCSSSGDRTRVWATERDEHGVLCEAHRVACPGLGRQALLQAMVLTGRVDIFKSATMALVTQEMWEETKPVFYMVFALKGLFGFFFILEVISSAVGASSDAQERCGALGPPHFPTQWPAAVVVVLAAGRLLTQTLTPRASLAEGRGALALHVATPTLALAWLWAQERCSAAAHGEALACAVVLLICLDIAQHFRGLTATASLCIMVQQIFLDILPFLAILLMVLARFGFCLWLLLSPTATEGFSSIPDALFSAFLMGVLGDFDISAFHDSQNPLIATTLFVLLEGIVLLLMLNLLIALMGSSYEKVLETSAETLNRERCKWVLSNLGTISMLPWWAEHVKHKTEWFHLLVPDTLQGAGGEDEKWSGVLASVKREQAKVMDKVDKVMEKVDTVMHEMKGIKDALKATGDMGKVGEVMDKVGEVVDKVDGVMGKVDKVDAIMDEMKGIKETLANRA